MKILVLANNDVGLFNFRKELIATLLNNHQVITALPDGERVRYFEEVGCKFINTSVDRRGINPFKDFRLMTQYSRIIKSEKPDVVLTYTIKPNIYGGIICSVYRIPYIVNITGLGTALENPGLLQFIAVNLYRLSLRKAEKVFFQNEDNKDFMLSKKIVCNSYDVLPGSGVNTDDFTLSEYPSGDIVEFVFVARIMKEKGIDQFLEAAKFIKEKYPETRFHICGFCEEDYEEKIKKMNNDGIIIYHGIVKDMKAIYRQISCTIHPTYYPEGMSNVLLESCAMGRPIITTNRPGCGEIVDDGVNGFVVKQQDSQDLIEKIEKFLKLQWDERRKMGLMARRKVETEFNRDIVIEKYMNEIAVAEKKN